MSRDLKIMLSDEQCDALAEEARVAGAKFFDYCRAKLLRNTVIPVHNTAPIAAAMKAIAQAKPSTADLRMDRLEAMMLQMAATVQAIAQPAHASVMEDQTQHFDLADVVTDAIINAPQPEPQQVDPQHPGVRHVGTRPPMPLSGRAASANLNSAFGG